MTQSGNLLIAGPGLSQTNCSVQRPTRTAMKNRRDDVERCSSKLPSLPDGTSIVR